MTAEKITQGTEGLNVPNEPIIPFIIGDGIGPDIWKASKPSYRCSLLRKPIMAKNALNGKKC